MIPFSEVQKHNNEKDTWVIIDGKVYDLTDFAPDHPGGSQIVTDRAGKDATEAFLEAHPTSIMKLTMGPKALKESLRGDVDPKTVPAESKEESKAQGSAHVNPRETFVPGGEDWQTGNGVPPIDAVLNLHDFEAIAQRAMTSSGKKQSWDYYSSGADDELTYQENVSAFQRIWLRPRILRDVLEVDMSSKILGMPTSIPLYLSAVAMCGMGHADGEVAWTRAAGETGVVFMVPNLSSKKFEDIVGARTQRRQDLMFQMYVNPDRDVVREQLAACKEAGIKALCLTVDSAVPGKRERDLRNKIALKLKAAKQQAAAAKGTKARKAGSYANRDAALNWKDIAWFKKETKIPIVLKGVGTGEDAVLAAKHGCKAIILSNHGGRNLDTSRSGIEMLPEVMDALTAAGYRDKIEVWVDGGVRRGTDILKALALGATAVGLGKPAVYSMSAYGAEGIVKMVDILKEELEKCMKLVGAATIADITPEMADSSALTHHAAGIAIPPSPFTFNPAAAGMAAKRIQGGKPPADMTAVELKAKIAEFQVHLAAKDPKAAAAMKGGGGGGFGGLGETFLMLMRLVMVMAVAGAKTVFALESGAALQRSALFLVVFLIVHCLGNMTIFAGGDTYNKYGHKLRSNPAIKFIEYYTAAGFLVHGLVASYKTWGKRGYISKDVPGRGKLVLTSLVFVAYLATHLMDIRFAEEVWTTLADGSKALDLYGMQLALFKR